MGKEESKEEKVLLEISIQETKLAVDEETGDKMYVLDLGRTVVDRETYKAVMSKQLDSDSATIKLCLE